MRASHVSSARTWARLWFAAQALGGSAWWIAVSVVLALWNHVVRPGEEAGLEVRFGDPFPRYRAVVRCWVLMFPGVAATPR